jgi:hypothetical protein
VFFALQSFRIAQFREDFPAAHALEHILQGKVRGMIVKGMGKCVLTIIPLTYIPLTFLPAFPSSVLPVVAAGRAVFFAAKSAIRPDASGQSAISPASSRNRPFSVASCLTLTI